MNAKVIQSRAVSDYLFVFCCLITISNRQQQACKAAVTLRPNAWIQYMIYRGFISQLFAFTLDMADNAYINTALLCEFDHLCAISRKETLFRHCASTKMLPNFASCCKRFKIT